MVAPTVAVVVAVFGPVVVVSDGCEVLRSALTVCVVLRVAGTAAATARRRRRRRSRCVCALGRLLLCAFLVAVVVVVVVAVTAPHCWFYR